MKKIFMSICLLALVGCSNPPEYDIISRERFKTYVSACDPHGGWDSFITNVHNSNYGVNNDIRIHCANGKVISVHSYLKERKE